MHRRLALLCVACTLACSDDGPDEDFRGATDATARGVLTAFGRSDTLDLALTGDACVRLGSLALWSRDRQAVVTFQPITPALEVGTYPMQWDDTVGPTGWLNAPGATTIGGSLFTMRGTTLITGVTATEVRGAVDWVVGVPPDIGVPPDPAIGEVIIRGTFRAERVAADVRC
jgi:hypothetical protein